MLLQPLPLLMSSAQDPTYLTKDLCLCASPKFESSPSLEPCEDYERDWWPIGACRAPDPRNPTPGNSILPRAAKWCANRPQSTSVAAEPRCHRIFCPGRKSEISGRDQKEGFTQTAASYI